MTTPAPEEIVQKRKVTMKSTVAMPDGTTADIVVEDYVPLDILDEYVEDARTRWQLVSVPDPDKHDPGPGGDKGKTHRPVKPKKKG